MYKMFKFFVYIFCCFVGYMVGNFDVILLIFNIGLNLYVIMYMFIVFYDNNYEINIKNLNCFILV